MDWQLHLHKTKLQTGLLRLTLLCSIAFLTLKEQAYILITSKPVSLDLDTAQKPILTKTPVQKQSLYVNEPVINVYSEPVAGAETITQALYGEPITVIEQQEGWLQISLPDQFEYKEEQVIDKPSTKNVEKIAAVYATVYDTIIVKPAAKKTITTLATYETVTEEMLITPAKQEWVKGKADVNCLSQNPKDCEVLCLKDFPATYKTITKKGRANSSSY